MISWKPVCGPELSQRMLLATVKSVAAMVRNWPWHSTRPSRWALASKWSTASMKWMPVSSCQHLADAAGELRDGC